MHSNAFSLDRLWQMPLTKEKNSTRWKTASLSYTVESALIKK